MARDDTPAAFWLRETIDPLEARALDLCFGRVFDVGAGAGLLSLELQRRGIDVTAIDIAAKCVAIMRERGALHAEEADLHEFEGGPFDTIVNLCNGLDKVGHLAELNNYVPISESVLASRLTRVATSNRWPLFLSGDDAFRPVCSNTTQSKVTSCVSMQLFSYVLHDIARHSRCGVSFS
jgi:SAM-dependent methyltransferase